LRPDAYQAQVARHLRINFELNSAHAIANFQASAKAFPLQIEQSTTRQVKAHFEGENVNLAEDFVATFDLDRAGSDMLQVMTYRDPTPRQPSPAESAPAANPNQSGFFTADALLADNAQQNAKPPKTTVILFDTSLSMQWEKLERSYEALETRSMPTGNSSSGPLLIGSALRR
jgi:Ca-activated chloride channel homolog